MARPPRIDLADGLYHVTSRGNGRQDIFWTDADRTRLLGQLADNLHTYAVVLYARFKHRRPGHQFHGRFKAKLVEDERLRADAGHCAAELPGIRPRVRPGRRRADPRGARRQPLRDRQPGVRRGVGAPIGLS